MGKGDKRTRRGKIFKNSFGKSRPKGGLSRAAHDAIGAKAPAAPAAAPTAAPAAS